MQQNSSKPIKGIAAIDKLRTVAKRAEWCTMVTGIYRMLFSARPMLVTYIDVKGSLYFLTHKNCSANTEILDSNEMQLTLLDKEESECMTLYGVAGIYDFKQHAKILYEPSHDRWFKGPDDPDIRIIRFQPIAGHFTSLKENTVLAMSEFTDQDFNRNSNEDDKFKISLN